jgi:MFS family permease
LDTEKGKRLLKLSTTLRLVISLFNLLYVSTNLIRHIWVAANSRQGYLPGYWIGIFLPDLIGRKRQQFYGSLIVCALYAIWAGVTNHTSTGGLMVLFTLSQLALNSGPNATTFLLPVELFPTRVRATAHGIAAASGKCGALLTAFAFGTITEKIGLPGVLGLFSAIMFLCALLTLMIPETKGKTLDDIEREVLYGEKPEVEYIEAHTPSTGSISVQPKSGKMDGEV